MNIGKVSKTVITCLGFLALLSIHQIYLSSITNGSHTENCWKLEKPCPQVNSSVVLPPSSTSQSATHHPIICDRSHYRYDFCSINGPTVMDPKSSTFLLTSTGPTQTQTQTIRPFPRKWENASMSLVKQLTLGITTGPTPVCRHRHNVPALIFSTGGFTGNFFHEFADGLIPLFITIHLLFHEQQSPPPVLVIANCRNWWISKYTNILRNLTPYPIINLDNETATHCFPSAHFGIISHGFISIDPALMPHSESLLEFRSLLDRSYSATTGSLHQDGPSIHTRRPRLVLVTRNSGGRVLKNLDDIIRIAEEVGFNVVLFEPNPSIMLSTSYAMINGSHAMLGVHGAALTHLFFLRPGSVFIQVVPIGIDWFAEICFGDPARKIGLDYIEYKIKVEESSLVEKYAKDDVVFKDPKAFVNKSFPKIKELYLKSQDVRLDVIRVRRFLEVAYEKAKRFMEKEG